MKSIDLMCLLTLVLTAQLHAQSPVSTEPGPEDSTGTTRVNSAGISLNRNLNTFNWVGRTRIDTTMLGTKVTVNQQYSSNLILLDGTSSLRQLQSNQQNISLLLGRHLTRDLTSQLQWSSLVYSDNKSVGLGNAEFHSLLGGIEYVPLDILSLTPLVGYRWEDQVGIRDKGLSYTMAARTNNVDVDGYQITGAAQFHEDRLNPRVLQRHFARLGAQKLFSGNTRDSIEIGYSRNRREFYDATVGNIESRIEDVISFFNLLDYEFDSNFLGSIFVNVSSRSLDRDIRHFSVIPDPDTRFNTTIEEFRLETYVQAAYKSNDRGLMAMLRFGHSERNEEHSATSMPGSPPNEILLNQENDKEQRKNNLSSRTSFSGSLQIPLSFSDRLSFSGAASILRYDTPSIDNDDDRDEQLIVLSVATSHRISQYFGVGVSLDGTLSHTVYLFESRSSNNNYNRVLRLAPTTTYRPTKDIASTNTFEVLANYTVYDFEQQVSGVRSFSYRQFGWVDSSSVELTSRVGLDFFSYLKLYERGQLKWADFSERTENSFLDRTLASQLRFSPEEGILFAIGLRYFSQSRYTFASGVKTLDAYIRSVGPTCLILWDIGLYSRLTFKGWLERRTFTGNQTQAQGSSRSLPNLSMNIIINL